MTVHVERLWQDLRHGARVFARNPALTAIAVLSIACGTGANVAMFSVADTMLLRPLPIVRPSDVLAVGYKVETLPGVTHSRASYLDYLDLASRTRTFEGLVAHDLEPVGLTAHRGVAPRVRFAAFVSHNFFSVLGVPLALGRAFHAEEAKPGASSRVVILSDAVWQADYAGDPAAVGRILHVGGADYTIVGVAPKTFGGLHPFVREDVFLPAAALPVLVERLSATVLESRTARLFSLKGRLRDGVSITEARAELSAIGDSLAREYPESNADVRLIVQTELSYKLMQRPLDAALIMLVVTLSAAVLCVACANVAGLLASRAPIRAREMSLRLAVGANRARLIRQLLTESLGIALAGGAAGLLVAQVGIHILRGFQFPTDMISPPVIELNRRALMVSLAVAMASALLAGLWPALQMTRVNLAGALKTSDHSPGRRRLPLRSALVATQVALTLVLVTIATLTFEAFYKELRRGPGFRVTRMAKATIDVGQAGYTHAQFADFFERVLADARQLPGVRSASLTSAMPLFSYRFVSVAPGSGTEDVDRGRPVWTNSIDGSYFTTMAIPLLAGRTFTAADHRGAAKVAIVNSVLARHLWPEGEVIGRQLHVLGEDPRQVTIVGVVAHNTYGFPGERPQDAIFFPHLQQPSGNMVLLAHTDGPSASILEALRDVAQRPDPAVPVFDVQTIERFHYVLVNAHMRVVVRMVCGIGVIGVALTMAGLYGLVSFAVSRRTREIGIRMAIGATHVHVVTLVLRQGMAPVWFGVAGGLVLSVLASSTVLTLVPTEHKIGLITYVAVVPLVLLVTTLSAAVPACRAARIDPTLALRCE